MADDEKRDWRELCKAASREHDPSRLLELVRELNDALDEQAGPRFATVIPDPGFPSL